VGHVITVEVSPTDKGKLKVTVDPFPPLCDVCHARLNCIDFLHQSYCLQLQGERKWRVVRVHMQAGHLDSNNKKNFVLAVATPMPVLHSKHAYSPPLRKARQSETDGPTGEHIMSASDRYMYISFLSLSPPPPPPSLPPPYHRSDLQVL
jgi:hypothetical protein